MKPFCYHSFDLRQLVSFAEIARTGSFRRAAKTLHIAQPALSRQIKQLEAALGINLFDRAPRRLHLTIEGRELAGRLPALFSQIDHLIETVNLHRSQIFREFVSDAGSGSPECFRAAFLERRFQRQFVSIEFILIRK